jgi:hypothetical protein
MSRSFIATLVVVAGALYASAAAAEPVITSIAPASGFKTGGGQTLTINGTAFSPSGNSATVGGSTCTVSAESDVNIECRVPEGSGATSVQVVDGGGLASQPYPFSYDPPTVSSVTPSNGATLGHTPITIRGESFGPSGAGRAITVGGGQCPLVGGVATSHTELQGTLPEGQGHDLAVHVTVDGLASTVDGTFSYDPPSITAVNPTSGPSAGGIIITITGENFGTQAFASVGGADCPAVTQTHSSFECTAPAGFGTDVDVQLTAGGQSSNSRPFSYRVVASACDAAKWKAAGAHAACLAKAEAKAAKLGVDPNADSKISVAMQACDEKAVAACTKAETKLVTSCSQIGTCDDLRVIVRGWDATTKGKIQ